MGNTPIGDLVIHKNGKIAPVTRPPLSWYGGKGLGDVRTISGEFLLSLQSYWEQEGDDILKRVGAQHPELIFAGMVKLANVTGSRLAHRETLAASASKRSSTS